MSPLRGAGNYAVSNDPTTASIEARNDELVQLRAENQRLRRALVEARTEVEVTRRDRDRLAAALRVKGHDLCELSESPEGEWSELVARLNMLRKRLDEKPRELRMGYPLQPGGILNAYREGDLSFDEACGILGSAEFSAALRGAPAAAEAAWSVVHCNDEDPVVRRYPVPGGWLYQVSVLMAARYRMRTGGYDLSDVAWHPPQVVAFHLGEAR